VARIRFAHFGATTSRTRRYVLLLFGCDGCCSSNIPLQGLIFVVDSNDRERVAEASEELQKMLREDELRDAKLLVFAVCVRVKVWDCC
jgi:hypothetical protein